MKTTRNAWYKSGCPSGTHYMWNNDFHILWSHVTSIFYEDLDMGLHLLPKLTHEHINLTSYSVMNVRLATEVLSSTDSVT